MRQGQQQNRRGRGRGGRKGQSPLSRSFESNGPDIKIRGTAQHIAEKYMTLARDAIGSGDLVLGESYLQHAEHYNRIILAAQVASGEHVNGNGQRVARPEGEPLPGEGFDDDGDDDGGEDQPGEGGVAVGAGEQPASFEPRHNADRGDRNERHDRGGYQGQREGGGHYRDRDHQQGRNCENCNFDNRPRNDRQWEPRGQNGDGRNNFQRGGYQQRGNFEQRDNRDNRGGGDQPAFEPRFQNNAPANGHGDQPPAAFEQPRVDQPPMDVRAADHQTGTPDGREALQHLPRAPRRRRPRHENGSPRGGELPLGGEAAPSSDAPVAAPEPSSSGGDEQI